MGVAVQDPGGFGGPHRFLVLVTLGSTGKRYKEKPLFTELGGKRIKTTYHLFVFLYLDSSDGHQHLMNLPLVSLSLPLSVFRTRVY